jgi:hypothetical protein
MQWSTRFFEGNAQNHGNVLDIYMHTPIANLALVTTLIATMAMVKTPITYMVMVVAVEPVSW